MMTIGYLAVFLSTTALGIDEVTSDYLSDVLDDRVVYSTQAWGELGVDTAVRPTDGRAAMALRIKDTTYEKGLGHHASGEIVVDLNGDYTAFSAEVGVQWQGGVANGSVVFQVYVDDELKFDSGVMHEQDAPRRVGVNVKGAGQLRLAVTDAGDGIMCDCADWANARLVRVFGALAKKPSDRVDIGPFARVVTWDPDRMDGARSNRVQEFRKEDVYLETPVKSTDGVYDVPRTPDGRGCIGLQWAETRFMRDLAIEFAPDAPMPSKDGVQVQCWTGESPWQGAWKVVNGEITVEKNRWTFPIVTKNNKDFPRTGVSKIRWIFPKFDHPITVSKLAAYTRSLWNTATLRVELEKPQPGKMGAIEIYNGVFLESPGAVHPLLLSWDLGAPAKLTLKYTKPKPWKTDRTILRFYLPDGGCGVAVEDVVKGAPVYVRNLGVYVVPATVPTMVAEYRESIKDKKTVLQRVREMPDQTLAQALEKTHVPIQNNGPMMISLACDNRKCIVHRDGVVQFEPMGDLSHDDKGQTNPSHRLVPKFGSGKQENLARRLQDSWLPAPVTSVQDGSVVYQQCTFVAPAGEPLATAPLWLNSRPLCVADFLIENTGEEPADASLTLAISAGDKSYRAEKADGGALFGFAGQVLAFVDSRSATPLTCSVQDTAVTIGGTLPARAKTHCYVHIPAFRVAAADFRPFSEPAQLFENFKQYWKHATADAVQIEIPDPLLANVIRASQAHCLLAARNEQDGMNVAPWIASDRYGPLESEAHSVILGMDLMGRSEYARRSLDFFIKRYSPNGFLTTGYTLMGTGWHLWTLARHYGLTADKAWLDQIAPQVSRACQWIGQQVEKTKRDTADLEEIPECGLVPPGVGADWNRFAYRFAIQAHYYAGLHDAAAALERIKFASANRLLEQAASFRANILRAYRWNQARSPVLPISDGTFVPAYGGMLHCFGATGEMIPGEDGNRSWAYDVELGSHHLIPLGVLDAQGRDAADIMDHMEDVWFLHSGMGEYPEGKNHADWFNQGGFSKVQPYYTRNAEICAARDDVKPFIRSYFNAIASLLNLENLSFWEHFHNQGAWNKTHETGWFLVQTRTMFITERGNELWLAPFVTSNWMQDGMTVAVKNAPTEFGPVSYRIVSSVAKGFIEATVEPPTRSKPEKIVVRFRHPQGLPIQSVQVNGKPHTAFEAAKECVALDPPEGPATIRVAY